MEKDGKVGSVKSISLVYLVVKCPRLIDIEFVSAHHCHHHQSPHLLLPNNGIVFRSRPCRSRVLYQELTCIIILAFLSIIPSSLTYFLYHHNGGDVSRHLCTCRLQVVYLPHLEFRPVQINTITSQNLISVTYLVTGSQPGHIVNFKCTC
ncbi:hypothetical protein F4809DRAFT_191844 [Biscogniauxia mediterranea]|nr:hypothetical protein F4809DRAFT_191844 [Biscogniauxia mediterranea]